MGFWAAPQRCKSCDYSSAKWLLGCEQPGVSSTAIARTAIKVEELGELGRARYSPLGLHCLDRAPTQDELDLLGKAFAFLDVGDGLYEAIFALVRRIHLLVGSGPGYDVSHSDPDLPFSIFLSLPLGETQAALRAAESVLHEAMHLQLSLLDATTPIVSDARATGFSPWQRRQRPILGLVHGLYVFRAIDDWLVRISSAHPENGDVRSYVERRRSEIANEVAAVAELRLAGSLTIAGQQLVSRLLTLPQGDEANPSPSR